MIELNKIYNEDCLETMKRMPDNFVDLVLTDPPYGKMYARGKAGIGSKDTVNWELSDLEWDSEIPDKNIFNEMFRISKNQIIWGGNYFVDYLKPSNCWLVWDKKTGKNFFADCELAYTSFNSVVKKYEMLWLGAHARREEPPYHPTQKPLKLFVAILRDYYKSGIVYDPFIGSGTTGAACNQMGIDWIGSEINPDYCAIAEKRIKAERDQTRLL